MIASLSIILLLGLSGLGESRDVGKYRLVEQLSEANYAFSIDLYKNMVNSKPRENLVTSGFSVSSVLAMLLEGSRGRSAEQLQNTLRYNKFSRAGLEDAYRQVLTSLKGDGSYDLLSANSLWVEESFPIMDQYKSKLTDVYQAEAKTLHLPTSKNDVNGWVSDKTQGMIPQLLEDELGEDVVVLLLNAIYFKGVWETSFKNRTFEAGFLDYDDEIPQDDYSSATTRMMYTEGDFEYTDSKELRAEVVDIPYKGGDMSMTILLPHVNILDTESRLNPEALSRAIGDLKETDMSIVMPVFKIESTLKLKESLSELGVKEVFSDNANLAGIHPTALLQVSEVVQKAKIEVNEHGTKAAAATEVEITNRMGRFHSVEFRATHPFMFVLRHKSTNTILFSGRYTVCEPFSKQN